MVVSEEQKRSRINQKKRKPEESPHSNNMVAVRDLDEEQISPKERVKKMKKVKSPHSNMVVVPDLDEEQISPKDSGKKMKKEKYCENEGSRAGENKLTLESNALPSCIDKLRDELSCAICLEICYEPTSLWCGHSFCIRCLRLAVIKFGNKCPKCHEFIRKGRPYNLNTVVWNTIQLLFPQEVEARKVAIICK